MNPTRAYPPTTDRVDAIRDLAAARGLRLLQHPSTSHDGRWKLKDGDGNMVVWPAPLGEVQRYLEGKPPTRQLSLSKP